MAGGPLLDLWGGVLSCLELDACAGEPMEYRAGLFSEAERGGTIANGVVGGASTSAWVSAVVKGSGDKEEGEAAFLLSSRSPWVSREDKKSASA